MKGNEIRNTDSRRRSIRALSLFALILIAVQAAAQTAPAAGAAGKAAGADSSVQRPVTAGEATAVKNGEDDPLVKDIFRKFHESYRLGPADELAIRVKGQPEYSIEKAKISPVGTIYHPLLGEVTAAGLTLNQLKARLVSDLSEYVLDPIVNIELIEAHSAKYGVIGEVPRPGIFVMARPMTVLDAITEAGGLAATGKSSNITVLRMMADGRREQMRVNLKEILKGRAAPEANIALQAGDTVIVHGNAVKALSVISSIASLTSVLSFIAIGAR